MDEPTTPQDNSPATDVKLHEETGNISIGSASAVKIPPFWAEYPELWFAQIECQFQSNGVKKDISKFNLVVGHLEAKVLQQVSQAIINPPEDGKYQNLKRCIMDCFAESEHSQAKKLLSEMELGDKRPSQLLNIMKTYAGNKMSDDFLKTLWMQRMPTQVQQIISTIQGDTQNLATVADKIMEVGTYHQVSQASSGKSSEFLELEQQIFSLTKRFEKLEGFRGRSRSRSNFNERSRSSTNQQYEYCWYHFHFGENATKCIKPCQFSTKN